MAKKAKKQTTTTKTVKKTTKKTAASKKAVKKVTTKKVAVTAKKSKSTQAQKTTRAASKATKSKSKTETPLSTIEVKEETLVVPTPAPEVKATEVSEAAPTPAAKTGNWWQRLMARSGQQARDHKTATIVGVVIVAVVLGLYWWWDGVALDEDDDSEGGYPLVTGEYPEGWNDTPLGGTVLSPAPVPDDQKGSTTNVTANGGNVYQLTTIYDQQARMPVFNAFMPVDWQGVSQGSWSVPSAKYPATEQIGLFSPDNMLSVVILSPQSYMMMSNGAWGDTYADGAYNQDGLLMLRERDACEVVDEQAKALANGAAVTMNAELEVEAGLQSQLEAAVDADAQAAVSDANVLFGDYVQINITDKHATSCRRRFVSGESVAEITAVVTSITTTMNGNTGAPTQTLTWDVPYVVAFVAANQETFAANETVFQNIVANSQFAPQFAQAVAQMVAAKNEQVMATSAARSGVSLEASRQQLASNYESVNDRVADMWDSVIKEEDVYTDLNGNRVTTSMFNETVAQDGDKYYVGKRTGVPQGFTELHKEY